MKPSHKRPELLKTLARKWTSLKKWVHVALGVSHLENVLAGRPKLSKSFNGQTEC